LSLGCVSSPPSLRGAEERQNEGSQAKPAFTREPSNSVPGILDTEGRRTAVWLMNYGDNAVNSELAVNWWSGLTVN